MEQILGHSHLELQHEVSNSAGLALVPQRDQLLPELCINLINPAASCICLHDSLSRRLFQKIVQEAATTRKDVQDSLCLAT